MVKPKKPVKAAAAPADQAPVQGADRKRLQMADIARLAGVSVSTVSRALAGSERIGKETRDRIADLARSLHYSINVGAQNLRLGQNRTIAVVIPYDRGSRQHISDPFFLSMVGSLADALTERGFDMLLSRVDADNLDSAARVIETGVAFGVILIGQWRHHDQLNALAARRVPIVVWGAQFPQQLYCTVGGDNLAGGALATQHLLDLGARRIAFVGDPDLPEVSHRHRGHVDRLKAAGLVPDAALLVNVPFDADQARAGITRLCERGVAFDAVFACSDVLASAAMQVLQLFGRRVPDDVAVVGYDDIEWASHSNPPLTTVRQPIARAGVELVDALLRTVQGEPAPPRILPVELVVRASSTRAPAPPRRPRGA
ncbi:MAG: LacI family DNA-binding transcriptional regulator [Proteobacteria bacterium]|nr:LacI family DNA-binding transcriptional regulator [Pseudomonadota bacterium]